MPGVAFLAGLGIALSLAAPPGPMNALIAREASRHGAWLGFRAGVAAPIVDLAFLAAVLAGAERVVPASYLRWAEGLGALLMLFFAWQTVRPAMAREDPRPASFALIAALALTNPFAYAWWGTSGVALFQGAGAALVAGFMLGIFGWVAAFSWLVAHGAGRWPWFPPAVAWASAGLLVLFAALLGLRAAGL